MKTLLIVVYAMLIGSLFVNASLAQTSPPLQSVPTASASADRPTPFCSLPVVNWAMMRSIEDSLKLSKAGDEVALKSNWKEAETAYQQALVIWKDNNEATYGLAKCYEATGDTADEIKSYRRLVYSSNRADKGYHCNDNKQLIEFVLLLSKSGQASEALSVYQHAVARINQPGRKVPLPTFAAGPGHSPLKPEHLQAMAHISLSIVSNVNDALPQLQEAIRLYPDSAIAYFYLGDYLRRFTDIHKKEQAKDAYAKAMKLGSGPVRAAAQDGIKQLKWFLG